MTDIRPAFVVGHPYSGTTFLQLLMSSHPSFSSAPETHFFTYMMKPIKNWKNSKLNHKQLDFLFERFTLKPQIKLDTDFKKYIKNLAGKEGIAPAVMLNELMIYFAKKSGAKSKRWIEKTPRHAGLIQEILILYPNAKFIYIIRDPRDVVSSTLRFLDFKSEKNRWWHCAKRAEMWKIEVENALKIISSVDKKYVMVIRYDDIVQDPEDSLKKIMEFLNEKYYDKSLEDFSKNYRNVTLPFEESYKNLASVGKIVDCRGIWKKRMSENDARIVETICYQLMVKYNYLQKKPSLYSRIKGSGIIFLLYIKWFYEVFNNMKCLYKEKESLIQVFRIYQKKLLNNKSKFSF